MSIFWIIILAFNFVYFAFPFLTRQQCYDRCGLPISPTVRMLNGEIENQNRWAVRLTTHHDFRCVVGRDEGITQFLDHGYSCTGTIIAPNFVLTAAHCFRMSSPCTLGKKDEDFLVGPEDVKITTRVGHPDQRIYSVKKVYMHSQFRPGDHDHDIAIVELTSKIPFDINHGPICLGRNGSDITSATAYGYGLHLEVFEDRLFKSTDNFLRKDVIDLIPLERCRAETLTSHGRWIDDMNLCGVGTLNGGIASGDSGGPLLVTRRESVFVQIGISSTGLRVADEKGMIQEYDKFISMNAEYCDWIKSKSGVECKDIGQTDFAAWNDVSCQFVGAGRPIRSSSPSDADKINARKIRSEPEKLQLRGVVICSYYDSIKDRVWPHVVVELWEDDSHFFAMLDRDDLMGATTTNIDGSFSLEVRQMESEWFGGIEPYLLLRHRCLNGWPLKENCTYVSKRAVTIEELEDPNTDLELHIGEVRNSSTALSTWMECTDEQGGTWQSANLH